MLLHFSFAVGALIFVVLQVEPCSQWIFQMSLVELIHLTNLGRK